MGQVMAKPERIVFEYGYGARIASAFVALLMWGLVLASLSGATYLLVQGDALAARIGPAALAKASSTSSISAPASFSA